MCLIFVVVVGFKTRAAGPTILSVILAAMVWWGAANMDLLSDKTGEDVTQSTTASSPPAPDRHRERRRTGRHRPG
ncbi:hypothetical protein SANTM175S_09030 [Streptomyces antimycoticus]